VSYTWYRSQFSGPFYDVGWWWLCAIPNGSTYRRVRFAWGFAGFTEVTADLYATAAKLQTAGLVTTIGNGTETPPHPYTTPNDVDPPTQRWLWWEVRQPVALSIDAAGGTVSWRDSGPQEIVDVKSQVLATGIPGGDSLNLWFSYQAQNGAWDTSGEQEIWVAASVLYSTP
jgi:hypothetical protein